ncbi:MAG: hypothetical protein LBQ50_01230 [Planctomycetaceae bacterium]|nr:hypothetical protein [Planctomycetaceae bacterium]
MGISVQIICTEPKITDDQSVIVFSSNKHFSCESIDVVSCVLQPLVTVDSVLVTVTSAFASTIETESKSVPVQPLSSPASGSSLCKIAPLSSDSEEIISTEGYTCNEHSEKNPKKLCERPGCPNHFVPDIRTRNHKYCSYKCYNAIRRSRSRLIRCYHLTGCRFALEIYWLLGGTLHRLE